MGKKTVVNLSLCLVWVIFHYHNCWCQGCLLKKDLFLWIHSICQHPKKTVLEGILRKCSITSRLYSCDSENKYASAPLTQISQPESLSLHLPEPQVVSPAQETSITGNKVPLIRPTAKLLHPVQEVCLTIMFRVRFTKEERSSSIWRSEGRLQKRRRANSFISYRCKAMELGKIQLVFLGIVLYKYIRCVLFVLSLALHVAKGVGIAIILLTVFISFYWLSNRCWK